MHNTYTCIYVVALVKYTIRRPLATSKVMGSSWAPAIMYAWDKKNDGEMRNHELRTHSRHKILMIMLYLLWSVYVHYRCSYGY